MTRERIRALVESNPGQASEAEYTLVHDVLTGQAPCNLLVFGVGRDSSLWMDTNDGGLTVFVEDVKPWAAYAREHVEGITVIDVRYWTLRIMWHVLRFVPAALFMRSLPAEVLDTEWDVILVDAPRGTRWYRRGRMMSIYMLTWSAMPVAVSSYLFAQQFRRKPEEVAGMVVVSTAFSAVTLPLLLLELL